MRLKLKQRRELMTNITNKINHIELIHTEDNNQLNLIQRDYDIALRDLTQDSYFQPQKDDQGPYNVKLLIEDNRLVFQIKNNQNTELPYLVLSLKPYRRLIKDYFLIVGSYDQAIKEGNPSRIEAIDMGRRGLHNEGAELLLERLESKIKMNLETARRLFTLICVLHTNKVHILR